MCFHDVAFLLSRATLSTTFHKNCDGSESLVAYTYLETVVGVEEGHAPCKTLLLN